MESVFSILFKSGKDFTPTIKHNFSLLLKEKV
jgi:hypothetical protein